MSYPFHYNDMYELFQIAELMLSGFLLQMPTIHINIETWIDVSSQAFLGHFPYWRKSNVTDVIDRDAAISDLNPA